MAKPAPLAHAESALRMHALSYPEAREEFPWGERVVKVRGKVFVFLGRADGGLSMSVKLPGSATLALDLPFASPTGYGLGRSGWVTARFEAREKPPIDLLKRWIDESYRAVAPRKLVAWLAAGSEAAGRGGKAGAPPSDEDVRARGASAHRRRRTSP